jgi:4-hydroxyphenylpyruvate dioxygenase-like putative hemolysin
MMGANTTASIARTMNKMRAQGAAAMPINRQKFERRRRKVRSRIWLMVMGAG